MLVRTHPFRELDRVTGRLSGTEAHPAVMPMDAWRQGDRFLIEFGLPGVYADAVDVDVERNVLTARAERAGPPPDREMLAAEQVRGDRGHSDERRAVPA
jgi:HSP20 family protein